MSRKIFRRLIRGLGYDGTERDRFDRMRAAEEVAPSQQRTLRDFFRLYAATTDRVYLLQLGANDGTKDDFTAFMRQPAHVEGVLVEPQQTCLARLSGVVDPTRIRLLPVALGEHDGQGILYRFDRESENGIQLDVFSSFDRRRCEEVRRRLSLTAGIEAVPVETCMLPTLLARGGLPRLDVFVCDLEGYDHVAIEQLVAAVRPLPVIVVFEHRWLSTAQRRRSYQLLEEKGYAVLPGPDDACCFRLRPADESPPRTAPVRE